MRRLAYIKKPLTTYELQFIGSLLINQFTCMHSLVSHDTTHTTAPKRSLQVFETRVGEAMLQLPVCTKSIYSPHTCIFYYFCLLNMYLLTATLPRNNRELQYLVYFKADPSLKAFPTFSPITLYALFIGSKVIGLSFIGSILPSLFKIFSSAFTFMISPTSLPDRGS